MTANLKPESKRDEFKRYLEISGVMDSLTRVLVSLYEETDRPSNAIEYFLERLATGVPMKAEMEAVKGEIGEMRKKLVQLEEENESLKKRLEQFEQPGAEPNTKDGVGEGGVTAGASEGSEGAGEE